MKRIETTTSCTAALTCSSRAASFLEKNPYYHSNDYVAVKILPHFINFLVHIPFFKKLFLRIIAPSGVYEYVIARTKYIDEVFEKALTEQFDQILLFGAGYDSRALRFQDKAQHIRIFELDEPHTQEAKIQQFQKRNITIPPNVIFIAINFEKESLNQKLDQAGFQKGQKTLFVLEGLLMYLVLEAIEDTFKIIKEYAGLKSRVVFDYVQASVLRGEDSLYGESGLVKTVSKAGEQWQSGFEPDEIESFVAEYGFEVADHKCVQELEKTYFQDQNGQPVGRINGTHCIVTIEKS